ncbi:uncharacterized protein LOC135120706 [Zophobas morio]|uniref:uncharacterized protein LOC135120706 n=1 Tax=Zophobas morio TaxID=2755281 RepID=UPI00308322E1
MGNNKRKAVLIAVDLESGANDMELVLINKLNFQPKNILKLSNHQTDPLLIPSRVNIIKALCWLVLDAAPEDTFFLYYGNARQKPCSNRKNSEKRGVIYPIDYEKSGVIYSEELINLIVIPIPQETRLISFMDSCICKTDLGLSYTRTCNNTSLKICSALKLLFGSKRSIRRPIKPAGTAIFFSGFIHNEKPIVTNVDKEGGCTMTCAFIKCIEKHYARLTYSKTLKLMYSLIKCSGSKPTLYISSTHYLDPNEQFYV